MKPLAFGADGRPEESGFDAIANCGTTGGSASAYTATAPAGFSLVDGAVIVVQFHTKATGSATLNVSSTGARTLRRNGAAMVASGVVTGRKYALSYNLGATAWDMIGQSGVLARDLPSDVIRSGVAIATSSSPGNSVRSMHSGGGASNLVQNVPTGGYIEQAVNGTGQVRQGVTGVLLPVTHTAPGSTENALYRGTYGGQLSFLGGPYSGGAAMTANPGQLAPAVYVFGPTFSGFEGLCGLSPLASSVPQGGVKALGPDTATIVGLAFVYDQTEKLCAVYSVAGTAISLFGTWDSQWVAGMPGAGEIGVLFSSGFLFVYNNSGDTRLISGCVFLAN